MPNGADLLLGPVAAADRRGVRRRRQPGGPEPAGAVRHAARWTAPTRSTRGRETWREQPRPARTGRWYPGQVELADGRIVDPVGLRRGRAPGARTSSWRSSRPRPERGGVGTIEPTTRRATATPASTRTCSRCPTGACWSLGGPDRGDVRACSTRRGWTRCARQRVDELPAARPTGPRRRQRGRCWPRGASRHVARDAARRLHGQRRRRIDRRRRTQTLEPAQGWPGSTAPGIPTHRGRALLRQRRPAARRLAGGGRRRRRASADDGTDGRTTPAATRSSSRSSCCGPGVDTAWTLGPPQQKWRSYHSTARAAARRPRAVGRRRLLDSATQARPRVGGPMDVRRDLLAAVPVRRRPARAAPLIEDAPVARARTARRSASGVARRQAARGARGAGRDDARRGHEPAAASCSRR